MSMRSADVPVSGDGIAISSPPAHRTFRGGPRWRADIPIAGTYAGSPAAIEASFAGGPFTVIDGSPAGGVFAGVLTGQEGIQGPLVVRHADDHRRCASVPGIGIGLVLLGCGQSNGVGQGAQLQKPPGSALVATRLGYDGRWGPLADPVGDTAGSTDAVFANEVRGGSVWPAVAAALMALCGRPVGIIAGWRNSSGLLAPGPIPAWSSSLDPTDRGRLFGAVVQRARTAVGIDGIDAVLWWQGEGDAGVGVPRADYAAALASLAAAFRAELGRDALFLPAKIQHCDALDDGRQAAINAAIGDAWGAAPGVAPGPDLTGIEADDADRLHLASDAALAEAAIRWARAIDGALLAPRRIGR